MMSDMGEDEEFKKFLENDPDDGIKPIDTGRNPAPPPPQPDTSSPPPLPPEPGPFAPEESVENKEQAAPEAEDFLKDALPDEAPRPTLEELTDEDRNYVYKGAFENLVEKKPTLKQIRIGCGWDLKNLEGVPPDLDVSLFLLDRSGQTRQDEDFIFYNQPTALEGGIRHVFDSRTGAGVGDDEIIFVDLNSVPFDIAKIMIILSVYDEGGLRDDHFGMVKNVSLGIADEEDREELLRYVLTPNDMGENTALRVGALVREGPVWFFEALGEPVKGGLARVATEYGIIVQELASSEEQG